MAIRKVAERPAHAARVVAVDVRYSVVRAVELEIRGDEARLLKRGSAALSPDAWSDPAPARDALAQAIRSALSSGGISATQVIAGLPRQLVTLKYAHLPHAEPEQIRGMVQYEAQQYVPFPLDEVVLDHQIVSDDTDEMTTVMVVAARRALVDELLAAFDKAGVEVVRLSVSALGLAEHVPSGAVPVALVDIERGEMDLAVVSAGRLLFTRAASLADTVDTPAGAHMLATEVARSLTAYQNEYRAHPVDRLLIAGAVSELPDIESTLGQMLDIPIDRLNSRLLPTADPGSLAYATAAGLALERDGQGIGRINLIPTARTERKAAARRRVQTGLAGLVVAVAALLVGVYVSQSMTAQKKEQARAVHENDRLMQAQKRLDKAKTEHDQTTKTYKTLTAGLGRNIAAVDAIKAISDAIPKGSGIYLAQLTFDRAGSVRIQGNAKTETAATDLVQALQSSGLFTDVRLNSLTDAQAETVTAAAPVGQPKAKPGTNMTFQVTCALPVPVLPTDKDKKSTGATVARSAAPGIGGDIQ